MKEGQPVGTRCQPQVRRRRVPVSFALSCHLLPDWLLMWFKKSFSVTLGECFEVRNGEYHFRKSPIYVCFLNFCRKLGSRVSFLDINYDWTKKILIWKTWKILLKSKMSSKKRYEQPNVELVHFFFRYQDNRHYPLQQSFVAFVTKLRDFFSAFKGKNYCTCGLNNFYVG